MGWRATFVTTVASLFTKAKQVNDADTVGAGGSAPEINKNDEKSVVQGGTGKADPAGQDGDAGDAPVGAHELKIDVPMTMSTSTDMAAETEKDNDDAGESPEQQRRKRQRILATSTSGGGSESTPTPWQLRHLFHRLRTAGSAVQDRLARLIVRSMIREVHPKGRQSTSTNRQRLHELAKKTIPLKSVMLVALLAYEPSYASNMWFMLSLQACILTFVTDIFSAVTLINLTTTVPVCWHCWVACFSGVSMTLVPYFLLVSMDKVSAYVILAVPLPVAVVALVNCVWAREMDNDSLDLDHVFDVSSAVTNVAAGGGLTGTIFGYSVLSSQQPVAGHAHALGFLLFLTISLGVYLMLVATVRPKALTRHTERLVYILLALLAATALVAAVEFVGWRLVCAVASIDVIEAAVSAVLAKAVHGVAATTRDEVDAASRKNEQRLTSIVIATVLFTLVMQLHSQKAAAVAGGSVGKHEVLRMLLYLAAFLWSFNRMLFFHEESLAGGDGGRAAGVCAWVWSTVQLVRTTVVVLAVLDHVYYNY